MNPFGPRNLKLPTKPAQEENRRFKVMLHDMLSKKF